MTQVTIIIPAYNAKKFIEESIDSVLKQTFTEFELIIINDCSKDNTLELIKKAINEDPRCFIIDLKENKGRSNALNVGIQQAKGKFICILDSDDIFFPDKLEQQVKFMIEHPDIDMIYGGARSFSDSDKEPEERKILDSSNDLRENLKKAGENTLEDLYNEDYNILNEGNATITACSVMIKKNVFAVCKFDEELKNMEDNDLWYQIIGKGFKIRGIKKPFYYYRIHKKQKSSDPEKSELAKEIIFHKIISGEYLKN